MSVSVHDPGAFIAPRPERNHPDPLWCPDFEVGQEARVERVRPVPDSEPLEAGAICQQYPLSVSSVRAVVLLFRACL